MGRQHLIAAFLLLLSTLCACRGGERPAADDTDTIAPGVYYWKTTFDLNAWERDFISRHHIGRIYLRLFDVDWDIDYDGQAKPIPIATTVFRDSVPKGIEVVPVVFITGEALKQYYHLAPLLYGRIKAMARRNGFEHFRELQLDCDWTRTTKVRFYDLCEEMCRLAHADSVAVSATIRLHQLRDTLPPVDRGVLMMYNTGAVRNAATRNSILDSKDVAPYLKTDVTAALPLSIAYPAYSWGVLLRDGHFERLLHASSFDDPARYRRLKDNTYEVTTPHYLDGQTLQKGDVIRLEHSDAAQITHVKALAARRLHPAPQSAVIYHLDSANLSRYSADTIEQILK